MVVRMKKSLEMFNRLLSAARVWARSIARLAFTFLAFLSLSVFSLSEYWRNESIWAYLEMSQPDLRKIWEFKGVSGKSEDMWVRSVSRSALKFSDFQSYSVGRTTHNEMKEKSQSLAERGHHVLVTLCVAVRGAREKETWVLTLELPGILVANVDGIQSYTCRRSFPCNVEHTWYT